MIHYYYEFHIHQFHLYYQNLHTEYLIHHYLKIEDCHLFLNYLYHFEVNRHHPQQMLHCWSLNYPHHTHGANQHHLHSKSQPYRHQHKILRLHYLKNLQSKYLYCYLDLVPTTQPVHKIQFVRNELHQNYRFDFQNTNHHLYMCLPQQIMRNLNLGPFQYQQHLLHCLSQKEHLLVTYFFPKSTLYLLHP